MAKANATRSKIISSALQLLSAEDIAHKLSFDAVSEKCGISSATIRYHFGGKASFAEALWQQFLELRKEHTLSFFYENNKDLLKESEGQVKFIHHMLRDFGSFFEGNNGLDQQRWIRLFFMESINFPKRRRREVMEYIDEELNAFHRICTEILPGTDRILSDTWFLFILHPLAVSYSHMGPQEKGNNKVFLQTNLEFAEKLLLDALHLTR